jgi:MFS family permease
MVCFPFEYLNLLLRSSWVQITDARGRDKSAEKRFTVHSGRTILGLAWRLKSVAGNSEVHLSASSTRAVLSRLVNANGNTTCRCGNGFYADAKAPERFRSSAQGLITLATYGVGMLIGFWVAEQTTDHFTAQNGHDWRSIWLLPAGFSVVVLLCFALPFKGRGGEKDGVPSTV